MSGIDAFKSATLYMRFAFCSPIIALPTTTPDTTAVVISWALWFAVARDIQEDITLLKR
jgi:hypothetical protein